MVFESEKEKCFNTASGKHCCNFNTFFNITEAYNSVSIPQAVSTVATLLKEWTLVNVHRVSIPQAVSTVATGNDKGDKKRIEFQYRKR